MENTLLAWCVRSRTIYVGMSSINSISRNWGVLPYQCQHTNTNRYLIWPNLLEVNPPQTHMQHILVFGWVWSTLTDLGMLSGISKQQVVRCASLSVSVHQHQSAPNMTIADKKHISPGLLRWKLTFQVKAHQSLYTTHWHIQNCCCYLCLLITLMHPDLSLQALHAQVDPMCMLTLGWWWLIPDHWFTQRSTHHPSVISTGY